MSRYIELELHKVVAVPMVFCQWGESKEYKYSSFSVYVNIHDGKVPVNSIKKDSMAVMVM